MTSRQKFLKFFYPALMWWLKIRNKNSIKISPMQAAAKVSFYELKSILNNGKEFDFNQLKGKKVMLVNTASNCGFTGQYEGLEKLHQQHKDKLVLIGFPANDFKEQEKGSDEEIATFCKINFGVTFLLMKKSSVVKGPQQNEVYAWLSNPDKNGWNNQQPTWNFCKYIVDENGELTNFFEASIEPSGKEISAAIN